MRALDAIALILLIVLLGVATYILWYNFPTASIDFEEFKIDLPTDNLSLNSNQFYPNMRYSDNSIGYSLENNCSEKKKADFEIATEILERSSIIDFYNSENAEIMVFCSSIAPKPEQKNHYIAGEGGPTEIINASRFAVIVSGEISLYREESCDTPKIALHELLHALGFDHNKNETSIMYPVTNCNQVLDQNIINEINRIYAEPSAGDILIENIAANKSGRYLNFDILIANTGLKKIDNITLLIMHGDSLIKGFEMESLDIGARKTLTVTNLRIPRDAEEIVFELKTIESELTKRNNRAVIGIIQQ